MAVTTTPRLGLTRWSAGTDPFRRSQLDTSLGNLETWAMRGEAGTLANRPAAGIRDRYYTDDATGVTYRDSGTAWSVVGANLAGLATVKATAGQAGNLTEWRDAAGALLASAAVDGTLTGKALATTGLTATTVGLVVKGAASQSANLAAFRNSAGTDVASLSAAGAWTAGTTSVTGSDTTTPPLTARLAAGSTAPSIARFQDSAGTSLAWVGPDGSLTTPAVKAIGVDPASTVNLVRGAVGQTARLTRWDDSTGANVAYVNADGGFGATAGTFTAATAATNPLTVKGAAAQSGDLAQWRNSANAILATVKADGSSTWPSISATATAPAVVPLTVKGAASQTGNLLEAYDSANARKFYLAPSGDIWTTGQATLGGNLTLGDVTTTSQKTIYVRALNSIDAKAYEARRYLANTTGSSGNRIADVLYANGAEVARVELQADGIFSVVRGGIKAAGGVDATSFTSAGSLSAGSATITSTSSTSNPLVVKGAASQSGDLAQWRNSADAVLAAVKADGSFYAGTAFGAAGIAAQNSADVPTFRGRAIAAQAADLLRLENSAGTALAGAKADGTLYGANLADTGDVTNAITGIDTASWTVVSQTTNKIGRLVQVYLDLVYKGAAVTPPADGNVTNITVGTIAAAYRPNNGGTLAAINGRDALVAVYSSGTVALATLGNGTTLAQNTAITVVGTYLAATV